MYDLITFGSITADLYFKADELTTKGNRFYLAIGGKYFIGGFKSFIGGGGANVAVGVKKNRLKTAVCGLVGNNVFRKAILHQLTLKGVAKNFLLFKQKHDNISVILLKEDGSRTTLKSENSQQTLDINKRIMNKLNKTRSVYLGNLPDVSIYERSRLLSHLKSKGILIITNLGTLDTRRKNKEVEPIKAN